MTVPGRLTLDTLAEAPDRIGVDIRLVPREPVNA